MQNAEGGMFFIPPISTKSAPAFSNRGAEEPAGAVKIGASKSIRAQGVRSGF
jgi:hypothetical protein